MSNVVTEHPIVAGVVLHVAATAWIATDQNIWEHGVPPSAGKLMAAQVIGWTGTGLVLYGLFKHFQKKREA